MWCAQIGHESVSLKYTNEIWGPTAAQRGYEGRASLGNNQPGDGHRFAGHGPIQLTGRANHTAFSRWCYSKGYITDPVLFALHPELVAQPHWGFLAASWYWTVARANLNVASDQGNVVWATQMINGGTNGLSDRTLRWNHCRPLGARLLPTPQEDQLSAQFEADARGRWDKEDLLDRDLRLDLAAKAKVLAEIKANGDTTNELLRQLLAKP
jgi:hypothetical protein